MVDENIPHILNKTKVTTEKDGLVREVSSKGLLASDRNALEQHRMYVNRVKEQQKSSIEINIMKDQIAGVERDIKEIKDLLISQLKREE
jgi:hypothetical protein